MSRCIKINLIVLACFFFSFPLYAAPKPTVPGAGNLKDYVSVMPPARLDSSFPSNTPYPTNKWYTSIFADSNNTGSATFNTYWGNRISPSPMTIVYDSGFPWSDFNVWGGGWGYSIGGQCINTHEKDFTGQDSNNINKIMPIAVQGALGSGADDVIKATTTKIKSFNDWSFTAVLEHSADTTKRMTTTFGRGFLFTYNYFSPGVNPRLRMKYLPGSGASNTYFYNNGGTLTQINPGAQITTDSIMIKNYTVSDYLGGTNSGRYQYFGIYAPAGSKFKISSTGEFCDISYAATNPDIESERYLSISLLKSPHPTWNNDSEAFEVFKDHYKYAYNFITNTEVSWTFNKAQAELTTNFNFTFDVKRSGGTFLSGQTVFALYPHQWKNLVGSPNKTNTYNTIRGLMKVHSGNTFSTKHKFNGMIPFLTNEVPDALRQKLQNYLTYDKEFNPVNARVDGGWVGNSNTYYHGKAIARAANLIPVFDQTENYYYRDLMINKLKTELELWFSGQDVKKYFGYDNVWGGIIGSNPGNVSDFGASKFNDHHFHYGYFIYASAILAIYDPSFAESTQYKGIVDLLVKEIMNPTRNDPSFPFLRSFDVYEGHSYANGLGGNMRDLGNDEESTSEAMNAWSGIYLWGLATNNQTWIDLAIYAYTTQYESIKNYYLNMEGDIWDKTTAFKHSSVGMLFDNSFNWGLWWDPKITQSVMGIQIMPMNPSMLYLGYDTQYAQSFYNEMFLNRGTGANENFWKDVWLRFKSLFDASGALSDWDTANLPVNFPDTWNTGDGGDDGSSLSFSYYFINFFNAMGTVDTSYYSDEPSFLVTDKNGVRTFIAYNPDKTNSKTVHFYKRAGASSPAVPNTGTMTIPPGSMGQTKDFIDFEFIDINTPYTPPPFVDIEIDVYALQTDNLLGATFGGTSYQDSMQWDSWSNTVSLASHNDINAFEGTNYISARRNSSGTAVSWGGWGFRFVNKENQSIDEPKNMSEFYNGTLEAYVKVDSTSTVAGDFEIGFKSSNGREIWVRLKNHGFQNGITGWQKISVPLNPQSNANITQANMQSVLLPFMMRHNAGTTYAQWGVRVYLDSIVWKKPQTSGPYKGVLRNRVDNQDSTTIAWNKNNFGQNNVLSDQYIEIVLNDLPGNTWGMQLYTDNKSTIFPSNPEFSGNISSFTVSGLVSVERNNEMLPVRWRTAPSDIPEVEIFNPNWWDPWKDCRDISAFDPATGLYNGCNEVKFMDKRGYRWNHQDYGPLPASKKIRLYFLSDFKYAKRNTYRTNIIIEFYNE